MKLFLFLIGRSRRTVILAVVIGVVSGLASIGLLALIHRALGEPGWHAGVGWAFVGLCVMVLVTRVGAQVLLTRLSQHSVSRLIVHLSERVLDAPLRHLEQLGSGRILATLTTDVNAIALALNGVPAIVVNLIILVAGVLYLGWLSPPAFFAVLLFLVLGVVSYRLSAAPAQAYLKQGREHVDALVQHMRTLIDGIKELKIHAPRRHAFMSELLKKADAQVRENQIKGFTIQAAAASWGRVLFFVAVGLVLFAWPSLQRIDQATLTAYVLTILYLMSPLEHIMAWLPLMSRARVALNKVEELRLNLEHGEGIEANTLLPLEKWQSLALSNVRYAYRNEINGHDFHLGPIDLAFTVGELVFITGGNGSGKTTLAKLITGLYAPDEGEWLFNGKPVGEADLGAYRQMFTTVFAETPVFEGLLGLKRENLDERARRYLSDLELDRKVNVNNGWFSTTDLSKGQRKRLALVTAYLEDRPIYVLDEWAADQDPLFREVFYRRILPDLKNRGKTVIAITHDDRYFDVADRVITLEEGRIRV